MQIKNARRWPSTGAKPYAIAILAIVIASALRFALHPVLGADLPFLSFTIAGFLVAFLSGLWPALLVVAGAAVGYAAGGGAFAGSVGLRSKTRSTHPTGSNCAALEDLAGLEFEPLDAGEDVNGEGVHMS